MVKVIVERAELDSIVLVGDAVDVLDLKDVDRMLGR
jgi:hypothetical protein